MRSRSPLIILNTTPAPPWFASSSSASDKSGPTSAAAIFRRLRGQAVRGRAPQLRIIGRQSPPPIKVATGSHPNFLPALPTRLCHDRDSLIGVARFIKFRDRIHAIGAVPRFTRSSMVWLRNPGFFCATERSLSASGSAPNFCNASRAALDHKAVGICQ